MGDIDELKNKLKVLRQNEENVSIEVLKTRYAKSYAKLLGEVRAMAVEIYSDIALDGIAVRANDGAGVVAGLKSVIDEQRCAVSRAVFKEYDADKLVTLAENLHSKLWKIYEPYWLSHCCLFSNGKKTMYYNDLTEEFLVDEKTGIWEKHPEWSGMIITAGACRAMAEGAKHEQ